MTTTMPAPRRVLRGAARAPMHLGLAFIGLLWLTPTVGLLLTSLLPASQTDTGWWRILQEPGVATLDNYRSLLDNAAIVDALWTTAVVAVGNTLILTVVAALAAYAFTWLRFPGRDVLFVVVVALLVVPVQIALIPVFSIYTTTGLFDTILGLILFHVAFGLPFGIFLLRNFYLGIPSELVEAARIDGASETRIFRELVLPLSRPAIASLAIFQFLWTWNDFLVALTFARDVQPITVAIFSQARQFGSNIDLIAPAAFVSLALPLAVFLAFQRYFVKGLMAGAVK